MPAASRALALARVPERYRQELTECDGGTAQVASAHPERPARRFLSCLTDPLIEQKYLETHGAQQAAEAQEPGASLSSNVADAHQPKAKKRVRQVVPKRVVARQPVHQAPHASAPSDKPNAGRPRAEDIQKLKKMAQVQKMLATKKVKALAAKAKQEAEAAATGAGADLSASSRDHRRGGHALESAGCLPPRPDEQGATPEEVASAGATANALVALSTDPVDQEPPAKKAKHRPPPASPKLKPKPKSASDVPSDTRSTGEKSVPLRSGSLVEDVATAQDDADVASATKKRRSSSCAVSSAKGDGNTALEEGSRVQQEGNSARKASSKIVGSHPTVILSQSLPKPPQWLLPADARVIQPPSRKPLQISAHCSKKTIQEAAATGLQATPCWPGLGVIPDGLKEGFQSLVILGPSGSGKSTLLKNILAHFFPDYSGQLYPSGDWPRGQSLIQAFETASEGRDLLGGVGLSSVPSWCKPFDVLSVGEKYRANIAWTLQQRSRNPSLPLVFDEWTSELDRALARNVSLAMAKRMRSELASHKLSQEAQNRQCEDVVDKEENPEEAEFEEPVDVDEDLNQDDFIEEQFSLGTCSTSDYKDEDEQREFGQDAADCFADDPLDEEQSKARLVMEQVLAPSPKDVEVDEQVKKCIVEKGPYIFASCHDDVLAYLQPEFVCLCAVGEAPQLLRNPNTGMKPKLQAVLRGDLGPLPMSAEHVMIGHWQVKVKGVAPFRIAYQTRKEAAFMVEFEGGEIVKLKKVTDMESANARDRRECFVGNLKNMSEVRIWVVSPKVLTIQQRQSQTEGGTGTWSKEVRAMRRSLPAPNQALFAARDPFAIMNSTKVLDYDDCDLEVFAASGWHLPPELASDKLYKGLARSSEPQRVSASDFRYDCKLEKVADCPRYLATYVGDEEGGLDSRLQEVSRLLDCPFDGLCVHELPQLPDLGDFRIGVLTGPSGSGKSTLARDLFGPSSAVLWSEDAPVVGHFASLANAREFCAAAHLNLNVAMRPFKVLSGGEQARAQLARLFEKAVSGRNSNHALVIDEFTSLVDRKTAAAIARGLQNLVCHRGLRRVVVVSCHDDYLAEGLLEPDWVFECHNQRLLRFHDAEQAALQLVEGPLKKSLLEAEAAAAEAARKLRLLHQQMEEHAETTCFSECFRAEIGAFGGALRALGERELISQDRKLAELRSHYETSRAEAIAAFRSRHSSGKAKADAGVDSNAEMHRWHSEAWLTRAWAQPELRLEVRRALPREWKHFREHHYKDHSLLTSSVAFVGSIGDRPCCFTSVIDNGAHFIHQAIYRRRKGWDTFRYPKGWLTQNPPRRLFREHRTVVLPDFQGMGLAPLLCDTIGRFIVEAGHDFTSQTIHPFYGSYRDQSPLWLPLPSNRTEQSAINGNLKYSHLFVGPFLPDGKKDPERTAALQRRLTFEREMKHNKR